MEVEAERVPTFAVPTDEEAIVVFELTPPRVVFPETVRPERVPTLVSEEPVTPEPRVVALSTLAPAIR